MNTVAKSNNKPQTNKIQSTKHPNQSDQGFFSSGISGLCLSLPFPFPLPLPLPPSPTTLFSQGCSCPVSSNPGLSPTGFRSSSLSLSPSANGSVRLCEPSVMRSSGLSGLKPWRTSSCSGSSRESFHVVFLLDAVPACAAFFARAHALDGFGFVVFDDEVDELA